MKKYKHKQTDDIVEKIPSANYYKNIIRPLSAYLPGRYIENSNDWEEMVHLYIRSKWGGVRINTDVD